MSRTVVQILDFHPYQRRSMEVFLISLAHELLKRGWRTVHVVAGEPGKYFAQELDRLKLPPPILTDFPLTFSGARALRNRLRPFEPTAIQTTFMSKSSHPIWYLKKSTGARRWIVGDQTSGLPPRRGIARDLLSRLKGRIALNYYDRVITVSEFVRQRDIRVHQIPANRITTIYNGIELESFQNVERKPFDVLTIAFAGQLIPEKGVMTLLQAVKELGSEDLQPFQVLIAGTGSLEPQLRSYCLENNLCQVQFLGHINWVGRLFASADIVVIPSEWEEACAFVVMEAMACGACVLASDAGGKAMSRR
jgi:glycosyltransferase involved in cell wall biosynthesis